jgi:hypothetical protein
LNLQAVEARHTANDDLAGATSGAHGNVEKWLHKVEDSIR